MNTLYKGFAEEKLSLSALIMKRMINSAYKDILYHMDFPLCLYIYWRNDIVRVCHYAR
jgi:hypothetical protein